MQQLTSVEHCLEMANGDGMFHKPVAMMFRPAMILAHHGRISEAIETAYTIHQQNYGHCHGVLFRVVTVSKTISFEGPPEDFNR